MARVYRGEPCGLDRVLGWLERSLYRLAGTRAEVEMSWQQYALAMLLFNMSTLNKPQAPVKPHTAPTKPVQQQPTKPAQPQQPPRPAQPQQPAK